MDDLVLSDPLTRPTALRDVLVANAAADPQAIAFRFLSCGAASGSPRAAELTRGDLDARARAVAARLLAAAAPGSRVLVLLPPGLDFVAGVAGCLYAGMTMVPCPPPDGPGPTAPALARVVATAANAGVSAVLACAGQASLEGAYRRAGGDPGAAWLAVNNLPEADPRPLPPVAGGDLALLQYTSGSTGSPKAVAVSQANLVEQLSVFPEAMGLPPGVAVVTWISVFHTLGLTGAVLLSQFLGGQCAFMTPEDFIAEPVRWLEAISAAGGPVLSCAPNFAYDRCVRLITPEQRSRLDLSRWHTALNSAERIRAETVERFTGTFASCGFRPEAMFPAYGLTEAMLVSGRHGPRQLVLSVDPAELERGRVRPAAAGARGQALVGAGLPVRGMRVLVVDPDARAPLGEDEVGEIWVAGPTVTQGYWRHEDETAETFGGRLSGSDDGPFLRTGDLGFFHDGELILCGRRKELIVIRGRNLYPQDIEATSQRSHPALAAAPAAAFSVDGPDGEQLVVVQVADPSHPDLDRIAEQVRAAVTAEHTVDVREVVLVPHDALPQAGGGKVRRLACRQAYLDGTLPVLASRAAAGAITHGEGPTAFGDMLRCADKPLRAPLVKAELRRRLAASLGIPAGTLRDDVPLASFGLESLRAIELSRELAEDCRVDLRVSAFLRGSISGLAAQIAAGVDGDRGRPDGAAPRQAPAPLPAADPARRHDPFPLTELQRAYFVGRSASFELGGVSIHFYAEFERPELDPDRLRAALERLVRRQEMLRAVVLPDGTQRVLPEEQLPSQLTLPVLDLTAAGAPHRDRQLAKLRDEMSHQVFPAGEWPMFEVRLSRLPDRWRTHVSLDLLVADVASARLFFQELGEFYADPGRPAQPPAISFRDCVIYAEQARASRPQERERAWEYWRSRIPTLPPGPDLPRLRTAGADTRTRTRRTRVLPAGRWRQLKELAAARGLTPSAMLVAAYAHTLARWSRSGHFVLNVPLFNRPAVHRDVDSVIGDFTTVTLLECDVRPGEAFPDLALRLQQRLWQDIEHQAVSGVEVIREIARDRGVRADTFAPVVFASAREQGRDRRGEGGPMGARWLGETVYAVSQTPQVLLDHQVFEDDGALSFNWDAVEGAFPAGVLDDMFAAYSGTLERLAAGAGWEPGGLDPLPERHRAIIAASNDTAAPIPDGYLFSGVIEQGRRHPGRTAIVASDGRLTFGEWIGHAARLAETLREAGVRPNTLVAVAADKSAAQLVAVLAIHLAGGAYLPVDPGLPAARQDLLLRDGEAGVVLTRAGGPDRAWPDGVRRIAVDLSGPWRDAAPPAPVQRPTDLAYVLYTSGSTGTPKGVMISHQAALNTLSDVAARISLSPDDRVLGLSALSFDLSVWDVFGVPGAGGATVLPGPRASRDPSQWITMMDEHRVTLWNSVPALLDMLLEHVPDGHPGLSALRLAWLSGDWIPLDLPERLRRSAPGARLVASGGPTETSIWCVSYPVERTDPAWESIPYGRPLRNHRIHVLNDRGEQCPLWVPGEMYICGAGLAAGYWRDEQRTAEAFAPLPGSGERSYRSGDLGRWLPDGNLEILGRLDGQVKLGGFRVEPAETEAVLIRHPQVRAAAVVASGADRRRRHLVAYVVPEDVADHARPAQQTPETTWQETEQETRLLGDVITDPAERLDFTLRRHGRRTDLDGAPVALPAAAPAAEAVERWRHRSSCRTFDGSPMPLGTLARLLECLRDIPGGVLPRHLYASAGGLYPVQAYLYVMPERIAGLPAGSYYYDPQDHRLVTVRTDQRLDADVHVSINQAAFGSAAFQLFLVCRAAAIAPLYGDRARDFALLEAGMMTQLLESAAAGAGLGVCQLGMLRDQQRIRDLLCLPAGDLILHSLLGGIRPQAEQGSVGEQGPLAGRLRAYLAERLPSYMVPARIVLTDHLPLTGRGKVDRAALAAGWPPGPAPGESPVPAHGNIEELIATVISRSLQSGRVGVDTNFFDLGANSLAIVKAHRELQSALGREFPLITMFDHTTVRQLAAALAGASETADPAVTAGIERGRRRRQARQASTARELSP